MAKTMINFTIAKFIPVDNFAKLLVPLGRIELPTSSLPIQIPSCNRIKNHNCCKRENGLSTNTIQQLSTINLATAKLIGGAHA